MTLLKHGNKQFQDFWKEMTPEEKEEHLLQRAIKKERKKLAKTLAEGYREVAQSKKEVMIAGIWNATLKQIEKAQDGDTQAYVAVFDRHIEKPTANLDVTSNGETMTMPTIIFSSDVSDEWKDE